MLTVPRSRGRVGNVYQHEQFCVARGTNMSDVTGHRWLLRATSVVSALVLVALSTGADAQRAPTHADRLVDSLIRRMTLEEKLGQLTQLPGRWGDTGPRVSEGGEDEIRNGHVGSFLG